MWVKATQELHLWNNECDERELPLCCEQPICKFSSLLCDISARCYFVLSLMYVLCSHHFCYALHLAQWGLKLIYSTVNHMPWQQPHVSLITGELQTRHGVINNQNPLNCSPGCSPIMQNFHWHYTKKTRATWKIQCFQHEVKLGLHWDSSSEMLEMLIWHLGCGGGTLRHSDMQSDGECSAELGMVALRYACEANKLSPCTLYKLGTGWPQ